MGKSTERVSGSPPSTLSWEEFFSDLTDGDPMRHWATSTCRGFPDWDDAIVSATLDFATTTYCDMIVHVVKHYESLGTEQAHNAIRQLQDDFSTVAFVKVLLDDATPDETPKRSPRDGIPEVIAKLQDTNTPLEEIKTEMGKLMDQSLRGTDDEKMLAFYTLMKLNKDADNVMKIGEKALAMSEKPFEDMTHDEVWDLAKRMAKEMA